MASSALLQLLSFFLLLIFALFPAAFAVTKSDCNIDLGSSLSTGDKNYSWLSPSGDFAFGFRRLEVPDDENLFLLAIWFDKIPEKTIVWSANGAPAPAGSKVMLTDDGELILYNPQMKEIWKAPTNSARSTCAAMLDSGNFVLVNGDSNPIWESFKEPTDTILPSQILGIEGRLSSRQSDTNYTKGRFLLRMKADGNLVLYTVSVPTEVIYGAYWASGTVQPNSKSQLIFDEAGHIYVEGTQYIYYLKTTKDMGSKEDFYRMARIDYDGVFRQYKHPRNCTSSWSIVQTIPEDICMAITEALGSGACGYNSYCVNDNGKPSCLCPEGYSYVDPLDKQKGCKPDFQLPSCQQDGWEAKIELIEFKELSNTDWPLTDYDLQSGPEVDKETCRQYCLHDCFCAVAIYNGNNCWKKRFPLSNGRKAESVNRIALIKVPRGNATDQCSNRKD